MRHRSRNDHIQRKLLNQYHASNRGGKIPDAWAHHVPTEELGCNTTIGSHVVARLRSNCGLAVGQQSHNWNGSETTRFEPKMAAEDVITHTSGVCGCCCEEPKENTKFGMAVQKCLKMCFLDESEKSNKLCTIWSCTFGHLPQQETSVPSQPNSSPYNVYQTNQGFIGTFLGKDATWCGILSNGQVNRHQESCQFTGATEKQKKLDTQTTHSRHHRQKESHRRGG